MTKKFMIPLLLGVVTEIAGTIMDYLRLDGGYEFTTEKFVVDAAAFALFYSAIPFIVSTIRDWRVKGEKNGAMRKVCVVCQLLSVCMMLTVIVSYDIALMAYCVVGMLAVSAVLLVTAVVCVIMRGDKAVSLAALRWAVMLLLAEYSMIVLDTMFVMID